MTPTPRTYSPNEQTFNGPYPAVQANLSRLAQVDDGIGALFTAAQIREAQLRVAERVPEAEPETMRAELLGMLDMLGLGRQLDPALFRPLTVDRGYNR